MQTPCARGDGGKGDGAVTDGLVEEDGAAAGSGQARGGAYLRRAARWATHWASAGLGPILEAERSRWALWNPVGVGTGVAIYFALPTEPPFWIGPTAAVVALLLAWLGRRRLGALVVAVALLSVALGFAAVQGRAAWVAAPPLQRELSGTWVTGRVLAVQRQPAASRVVLGDLTIDRLKPEDTPARVRIRLSAKWGPPEAGSVIRLRALLQPPPAPAAPGAFDFQRRAYFQGLGAVGFAMGAPQLVDAPPPSRMEALSVLFALARAAVGDRVRQAIADPGVAGVTSALMNGEASVVPGDVMAAFRNSGLAHLLAISGLHVGIATGLVFFVARALLALVPWIALRWPTKKIAALFGIAAAIAYTLLVGAPVPTLRSVVMTGLVMTAIIADRDPFTLRLVAVAAVAAMVMEPEGMLGPSFQMSFAAVVALIAAYEWANPWLLRRRREFGGFGRAVLGFGGLTFSSVVATLATTPYALFHFQQVAFYGVLSNMVAIPLTSAWVMPWALVAYLLMPFGLERPALVAMSWGVWIIVEAARWVAALPGATALVPAMPTAGIVAVTLGGLWLALWSGRWRLFGLIAVAGGMASPFLAPRPDLLVSGDGKSMAVRAADGALSLSSERGGRSAEEWLRRDGRYQPSAPWPDRGDGAGGLLTCDLSACLYHRDGHTLSLIRLPDALPEDCGVAEGVITAEPSRGCRAPLVIDRWSLRREGALALYVSPQGVRVVSVREVQGDRPWTGRPGRAD